MCIIYWSSVLLIVQSVSGKHIVHFLKKASVWDFEFIKCIQGDSWSTLQLILCLYVLVLYLWHQNLILKCLFFFNYREWQLLFKLHKLVTVKLIAGLPTYCWKMNNLCHLQTVFSIWMKICLGYLPTKIM